ncbi:MAG: hypothetical protein ACOH10_13675 [Rhodoglobus sp.]
MTIVLTALATVADLSGRLGVVPPSNPSVAYTQMSLALEDASSDLRGAIGQALNFGTSTVSVWATPDGYVRLPAVPAITITLVLDEGVAVDYRKVDSATLYVPSGYARMLDVTYTHGWATIPGELVKWTCVLAAASLAAAQTGNLGMSGGLSSVGVDDARATWATNAGEQGEGVSLPERVAERLRATYGAPMISLEYR